MRIRSGKTAVGLPFLDSDDIWLPDKLEKTITQARDSNASMVCTGFRRFLDDKEGNRQIGHFVNVPRKFTYQGLLGGNKIATSTVLLDTEKTGQIRMKTVYYDDFDCWLSILKKGHSAVGLQEDLMRYRVLQGSVSRNKLKSAAHHWDSFATFARHRVCQITMVFQPLCNLWLVEICKALIKCYHLALAKDLALCLSYWFCSFLYGR